MRIKEIKFIMILCVPLMVAALKIQAQQATRYAQGMVYEKAKGNPIPGATIMLMNENNRIITGTVTDIDGKFKVAAPVGITKIAFSFVGLKTQEYPFDPSKVYEIILQDESKALDEVVISKKRVPKADLGLLQKDRKDMSNAVSSVDIKVLETQSVSTVDQLLQGAAPGLQVSFNSGDPGAGASLRIRGVSSLEGNNSPLWVIDGVEMIGENYSVSALQNFGSNPIGDLDPSDIESIEILKDASATAIYGSRGANGVVVIKTKRGVKGKPQFSFSAKLSSTQAPEQIPLLSGDQQRMYVIESRANKVGYDDVNTLKELRGDLTREDAWLYNNNTDMMDLISRNGFLQNYVFSLRGGGERLNYYWSLTYDSEYGTVIGGGFERFTTMMNLDYAMSNKFKIHAKFQYANTMKDKRSWEWPIYGFNKWDGKRLHPQALARERAAFLPVYNKNGTEYYIEDEGQGGHSIPSIGTRMYNPIAMIDNATFEERGNRFTSSLSMDLNIVRNLDFWGLVSIDYMQTGNEFFAPSEALGIKGHHNRYNNGQRDDSYNMQIVNKYRLIYCPLNTEVHYLQFIGVTDLLYNRSESTSLAYNRSASSELTESNAAPVIENAGGGHIMETNVSLVLDALYKYKDRYSFNFSLKTEGSSKYGKDNPYSLFPTAGFAWKMQNEPFLKETEWIEELKPRFSYGQTGKLPNVNAMLSVTYANNPNGYMGEPFTYISKFANDNLHEERTTEYNEGIDWSLFSGRLSGSFDYYSRTTKDLLMDEVISSSTGFATRKINFGTMKNVGWEFGINIVPIESKKANLKWSVYFNITRNRNTLLKMPERLSDSEGYKETYMGGFQSKLLEGSVTGGIYGYKARGVYAADGDAVVHDFNGNIVYEADGTSKKMRYGSVTGDIFKGGDMIYEDINHDGVINDLDVVQIGDANVGYYGMFRHNINWKQWAVGLSFYYSLGQDVINGMRYSLESMTSETNQATSVLRRWRKQGDITDIPRAEDYCQRNYAASSRWVEDASFLKLKEVSVTYNVGKEMLRRLHLDQLAVFATGMNLLTWTKYKGIDPEIGLNSGQLIKIGIDNQSTPPSLRLTLGIRATF